MFTNDAKSEIITIVKNKGIIIAIGIVLLLGVGYFLMKSRGSAPLRQGSAGQTETSSGMKSLKDLLSAGIAQKCTYSTTDDSGTSEGTTFISGGKMRGNFSMMASGKTTKSHMISDGKTSWIWTDGETTGFKMMVEETSEESSIEGGTDWDQKVDYKCSPWVTDGSYFTPPSNVEFTDFSELLKGAQ